MDTTEVYEGFDLGLADPGLVEDTRIDDQAALLAVDPLEAAMSEVLGQFDRLRGSDQPAVGCLIRFKPGAEAGEEVGIVAESRLLERMQSALRAPDVCFPVADGDVALALAGCDVEAARKRVGLLLKLIAMDPLLADATPSLWAGMAPIAQDSRPALRTARLACDLASFQDSGHIEVIDL